MNYQDFKKNELFHNLEEAQIEEIVSKFIVNKFEKNKIIFDEGDSIDTIYLIVDGKVEIHKYDINGNKSIVNILKEYDMFAESVALANNNISPYATITLTKATVLSIHVLAFKELLQLHKKAMFNLLELLANKNTYLTFKSDILNKKTIKEKVIEVLKYHYYQTNSNIISLPFNKSRFAEFIGVNRSSLERELTKMKEEGILEYKNDKFYVNEDYLKH